jgi:hypothetical protein
MEKSGFVSRMPRLRLFDKMTWWSKGQFGEKSFKTAGRADIGADLVSSAAPLF